MQMNLCACVFVCGDQSQPQLLSLRNYPSIFWDRDLIGLKFTKQTWLASQRAPATHRVGLPSVEMSVQHHTWLGFGFWFCFFFFSSLMWVLWIELRFSCLPHKCFTNVTISLALDIPLKEGLFIDLLRWCLFIPKPSYLGSAVHGQLRWIMFLP